VVGHSHSDKNVSPYNRDNLSIAASLYDMLHPSPQIYAIPNIRVLFKNEINFVDKYPEIFTLNSKLLLCIDAFHNVIIAQIFKNENY
jgi:hypothetical protein